MNKQKALTYARRLARLYSQDHVVLRVNRCLFAVISYDQWLDAPDQVYEYRVSANGIQSTN